MEDLHNSSGEACPDLTTLQAWHSHRLEPVYWSHLKMHVDVCPQCQADLARMDEGASGPDSEAHAGMASAPKTDPHVGPPSDRHPDLSSAAHTDAAQGRPGSGRGEKLPLRAHLRLISTHGEVVSPSQEEPRAVTREAGPDHRTVGAAPPWLSPDTRPTGPLPPIRPSATLAAPPGPAVTPLEPPRRPPPSMSHLTQRPRSETRIGTSGSSPGIAWTRNPWMIGAVSAVVTLGLLYPAWLGLVKLPAVQQRLEVLSLPQALEPALTLVSVPAQEAPVVAPNTEPALDVRQSYAMLELTVPREPVGTRYEVSLAEERRGPLWSQMGTEVREGTVSLLVSPNTLGEGRYLIKTMITLPGKAAEPWLTRFQVRR